MQDEIEHIENDPVAGWLRSLLWLLVLAGGFWFLASIKATIVVFVAAWLISYLLNPAVDALQGRKIGPIQSCTRATAIGIVFTILLGIGVAGISLMMPQMVHQLHKLVGIQDVLSDPMELTRQIQERANGLLEKVPAAYRDQLEERVMGFIKGSASKIGTWVGKGLQYLATFLGQLISGFFLLVSALIVSLYLLQDWHSLGHGLTDFLPPSYRDDAEALSQKMNEIFGGYLKATILTSLAVTASTFIVLLVLKLAMGAEFPYVILVSFVAGLTYPIPVLGILATSILGGVLGFLPENNLTFALAVLIMINVVNNVIDRTVQPKLMSDAIGVSPLFVMFAAFAGGELMGIWGMLIGIPVAAMSKALLVWFHGRFLIWPEDKASAAMAPEQESTPVEEPEPEAAEPEATEADSES